jgi:ferritin heavy chain
VLPIRTTHPTNLLKKPNSIIMSMSKVRQNFHSNSEALINKQVNMEFYASYVYLAMVWIKGGS